MPLIGPIVAAVSALLIALSEGSRMALWTLLLYAAGRSACCSPLAVVIMVAVKTLWVRGTLGENTDAPGEASLE